MADDKKAEEASGLSLTADQQKYLEAVEWLISPEYDTIERTPLLAVAFIRLMMKTPGRMFRVPAKTPGVRRAEWTLDWVRAYLRAEEILPALMVDRSHGVVRAGLQESTALSADLLYRLTRAREKFLLQPFETVSEAMGPGPSSCAMPLSHKSRSDRSEGDKGQTDGSPVLSGVIVEPGMKVKA